MLFSVHIEKICTLKNCFGRTAYQANLIFKGLMSIVWQPETEAASLHSTLLGAPTKIAV